MHTVKLTYAPLAFDYALNDPCVFNEQAVARDAELAGI